VASAPPPIPEEAGSDGWHCQGSFLEHSIWLLLGLLSLLQETRKEEEALREQGLKSRMPGVLKRARP
jgi:hypothetical protein